MSPATRNKLFATYHAACVQEGWQTPDRDARMDRTNDALRAAGFPAVKTWSDLKPRQVDCVLAHFAAVAGDLAATLAAGGADRRRLIWGIERRGAALAALTGRPDVEHYLAEVVRDLCRIDADGRVPAWRTLPVAQRNCIDLTNLLFLIHNRLHKAVHQRRLPEDTRPVKQIIRDLIREEDAEMLNP